MAIPTWPATLPQNILRSAYSETIQNQFLRFEPDFGPAKQRRRFTAGVKTFVGSLSLDATQMTTFVNFWDNTIQGGTLDFNWIHPRTFVAVIARFTTPYQLGVFAKIFIVNIIFEVLP